MSTVKQLVFSGLVPYTGTFGLDEAAHLLRRTTFGATYAQIQQAATDGLNTTVATLLNVNSMPSPPLNYSDTADPANPVGTTWIDKLYLGGGVGKSDRKNSMDAWMMKLLYDNNLSIRERMTLFWHDHFAIEQNKISDPKFQHIYITLLRENCLGDFKQLVKDVTIDPAMLRYLDGYKNKKNNPNENYAREVLELFTIGKGPATSTPGDYTNYTEQDVLALARVFTGWRYQGYFSTTIPEPYVEFVASNHDTTDKVLSARLGGVTISDMGDQEYAHAIDIIFQQDEVARFICRKIYRYFVNFDLDPVEATVIEPLAQLLIANNYNIGVVIENLLKSEHFYDASVRGAMTKNPLEFVMNVLRQFEMTIPAGPLDWYAPFSGLDRMMTSMGMQYFNPPNVSGWQPYYSSPGFYDLWVNSVTIRPRMEYTSKLAQSGRTLNGFKFQIDVLSFVSTLNNPMDPNSLIDEISFIIFPEPIEQTQKDALKEILIPGLPDFEWTVEYNIYLSDPSDMMAADAVEDKLRNLIEAMLGMPEFHLM